MNRAQISPNFFLPGWVWLVPLTLLILLLAELRSGTVKPAESIVWHALGIIAGTALCTRFCRLDRQFDLFEPLHLTFAFFVIFYPVRALFAVWLDDSWLDPATTAAWKALWASGLGFVCFALGYRFGPGEWVVRRRTWLDRPWNRERARGASLILLLLGIAGFGALRCLGGSFLYYLLLDPDIKAPGEMKAWFFYVPWLCLLLPVGALVELGLWLRQGRRTLWTGCYCLLAVCSTFLLGRLYTVICLMMFACCWHYMKQRINVFQVALLFALVLAYLGAAGFYREWISPGNSMAETGELVEFAGLHDNLVLRYVVANLEELSNLSEVISITPAELPYQWGMTFTPVIFKPIPRVLMPSKTLGACALFTRQTNPDGYDSGFVTGVGAWGEWYMNFSWPGLVLGFGLTGALSAAAYRGLRSTGEYGRVLLYASFAVFLFVWLRSDFNSAMTMGLYYLIPIALTLAYITRNGGVRRPGLEESAK